MLHFDGKRRKDLKTGEMKECVSVTVTGPGLEKFLGDKSVEEGTGVLVGEAVISLLKEWMLAEKIKFLSYDTCSVNTGRDWGKKAASLNI